MMLWVIRWLKQASLWDQRVRWIHAEWEICEWGYGKPAAAHARAVPIRAHQVGHVVVEVATFRAS